MIELLSMNKGKKYFYISLAVLFLLLLSRWSGPLSFKEFRFQNNKTYTPADLIKSDLLKVVDGDTLILKIANKKERVRLVGLNTPEAKKINGRTVECFGPEASNYARKILSDIKEIYFEPYSYDTRDQYGRLLGFVFFKNKEGELVNFANYMIGQGYGYEYTYHGRKYKYRDKFIEAENIARKNRWGL